MTDPDPKTPSPDASGQIQVGDQSLHVAFQKQIADMLENTDLTEEQREQIMIALSCPCCGAGGLSMSFKIKTDSKPSF